ncbi:MAG: PKD domain-containing protein, partial [Bacteroidia bacterium]|nr:PKD domain-containing protein [Bacteroidia bacterium]MDW8334786.1 PKD domain-containing protein [Bacteroidia bacterium]
GTDPLVFSDLRAGDYTLELRNAFYGESVTQTISIVGGVRVDLALNAPKSAQVGEIVTFNAMASGAETYEWNFGDGTTRFDGPTTTHAYVSEGLYTALVKAANQTCEAVASQTVEVGKATSVAQVLSTPETRVFGFNESVTIRFGKPGEYRVEVTDLAGKLVATASSNASGELQLSPIPSGVYLVRILGAENRTFKVAVR